MPTPARLKVHDDLGAGRAVLLAKPVFTIGRKADNDLQLLSDGVSRYHAEIVQEGDAYVVVDKDSKHGTFVNGARVTRHALRHGDEVRIGREHARRIQFLIEEEGSSGAVPAAGSNPGLSTLSRARASANEDLQKLARFVEVNQAFKFSLTLDDVLCLIVDAAIEITSAERGLLMLRNETGQLEFKLGRDRLRNTLVGSDLAMSRTAVDQAFEQNHSVIIGDGLRQRPAGDPDSARDLELRTIACVPLRRFQMTEQMDVTTLLRRDVIGVLYVDSRAITGHLSTTSITLLESLAFEAAKSIESVRLMHEEKEKQRLEVEFGLAREVQMALLPTAFRPTDGFEIAAHSIPHRYASGDFYDLIALAGDRSCLLLADVAGKGVSAALLAAFAQGALRAQLAAGAPLAEVVTTLNRVLFDNTAADRFLTLFCGILERDGTFAYVNAGHNPPILVRRDGRIEKLSTGETILGAFAGVRFSSRTKQLEPGDVLVAYSDGVTEATNAAAEIFGEERLERVVDAARDLGAAQIKDRIVEEILSFTRGFPQSDDVTFFALKLKQPGRP